MEPGRVYVGRLPNHNGPVFVRRRRKSFINPFGVPSVTSLWAPPRAPSLDYQCATTTICQQQPQRSMLITQPPSYITAPQVVEPPAYLGLPPTQTIGTTTTTTTTHEVQPLNTPSKYACAACGKFRSPRYHYRHPLASGENPRPTLCRKCVKQHTSSEEFDEMERASWKKKKEQEAWQRRRFRSSSSEQWESSSSQDGRRRRHRYRSSNDSRRQRRSARSSSGVSNRIYIIRRPAERRRLRSSSDSVRIVRRVRSADDRPRPRPLPRPRHRYGPYDGHRSYEEYHSDEDEADHFGYRGRSRSRSRSVSRQSYEDSHSIDDDYVRISTSISHRRPLSLLDRLTRSRSQSRSSSHSRRWGRRRPSEYEEESVRVTVRSRDPSPVSYERHEQRYEERIGSPWRRGSDSMIVHRDATTLETRSNDYFDRRRPSGRSFASSSQIQTRRARSPSILRRRSMENGLRGRRRVRFAHSDESDEEFRSAGMVNTISSWPFADSS